MSNDPYQHRQFFEELGPFPDFKDFVDNHLVVIPPVNDNSSDEERSNEIKQLGQAYSKIKNHGKNI